MNEHHRFSENKEKILPSQTLLLGEPVFKSGVDEGKKTKFAVPLGVEEIIRQLPFDKLTNEKITEILAEEYFSITSALKEMNAPFRMIVTRRKEMDPVVAFAMRQHFDVRGLLLHEAIATTCFPRDMLVDFDGKIYINPDSNFNFPDNSGILSPLGEGGRVLKLDKKVFVPDPRGFVQTRPKYAEGLKSLSDSFKFGFLPHPQAIESNREGKIVRIFPNDHLDRIAAFIRGKDNKDYLLLDGHYASESQPPYGQHWPLIKEACQKLDVNPVVINRKSTSIPYALNLEQFADGTILLTGRDDILVESVKQIVGTDKVYVTSRPIVLFPLYRNGGIRCMLLHAPKKIVGEPIIA